MQLCNNTNDASGTQKSKTAGTNRQAQEKQSY
jgi:hypothetical protein